MLISPLTAIRAITGIETHLLRFKRRAALTAINFLHIRLVHEIHVAQANPTGSKNPMVARQGR